MSFTLADATTVALRELRKLGVAETPAAADAAAAGVRAAALFNELNARRVWTVVDGNAIPDQYYEPFIVVLAEHLRPGFTNDSQPADIQRRQDAEGRLASIHRLLRGSVYTAVVKEVLERLESIGLSTEAIDNVTVTDAIQSALHDLAQRRIIVIGDEGDIPTWAVPHIVTLTTARVQPKAYDQTAKDNAERQLASGARLDRTSTGLAQAALERLDALGATTAAIDLTAVVGAIQGVLDDLAARRVVVIANEAAVTSAQTPALVTLIAARVLPRAVDSTAVQAAEQSLAELARLDRAASTALVRAVLERLDTLGATTSAIDATAVAGAVQSLLDDLAARRVISIADEASITQAQLPSIVTLLAARVQPKAVPPDAAAAAQQALADIARLDRTASTALVRSILGRLRLSYPQAGTVADAQFVADELPGILADLNARVNVYIPDVDSVEAGMVAELTRFAAASIAGDRDGMAASERAFKVIIGTRPSFLTLADPDGTWPHLRGHFPDYR